MVKNKYGVLEYPPGSTARKFYDIDGDECTLFQLVNREPSWAVSRINTLEKWMYDLFKLHLNPEQYTDKEKEYYLEMSAKMIGFVEENKKALSEDKA